MGELETEYEGKVEFEVFSATSKEGLTAAAEYDFGRSQHGLATLNPQGEHVATLPGHNYGKEEIVAKIEELLR